MSEENFSSKDLLFSVDSANYNDGYLTEKKRILKNYKRGLAGVYCITQIIDDKIYIGSSIDIYSRIDLHFLDLHYKKHHNYKMQDDYDRLGREAFKYEIVWEAEDHDSKNYILSIEQDYIDNHKPNYNIKILVDYVDIKPAKKRSSKVYIKEPKKLNRREQIMEDSRRYFIDKIIPKLQENKFTVIKGKKSTYIIKSELASITFAPKNNSYNLHGSGKWNTLNKNGRDMLNELKALLYKPYKKPKTK